MPVIVCLMSWPGLRLDAPVVLSPFSAGPVHCIAMGIHDGLLLLDVE